MNLKQFPVIDLAMLYAAKISDSLSYLQIEDGLEQARKEYQMSPEEEEIWLFSLDETERAPIHDKILAQRDISLPDSLISLHDKALDLWETAHRDVCYDNGITNSSLHDGDAFLVFFPQTTRAYIQAAAALLLAHKVRPGENRIDYNNAFSPELAKELANSFNFTLEKHFAQSEFQPPPSPIRVDDGLLIMDGKILSALQNMARQKS